MSAAADAWAWNRPNADAKGSASSGSKKTEDAYAYIFESHKREDAAGFDGSLKREDAAGSRKRKPVPAPEAGTHQQNTKEASGSESQKRTKLCATGFICPKVDVSRFI
jgi:hypothetical protein